MDDVEDAGRQTAIMQDRGQRVRRHGRHLRARGRISNGEARINVPVCLSCLRGSLCEIVRTCGTNLARLGHDDVA